MSEENGTLKIRAGSVYYHVLRGKACRAVKVLGEQVQVKFHRDGFSWNAEERIMRGPDGAIVSMEESREYAVVPAAELTIATPAQMNYYLGSKILHIKKEKSEEL